MAIGSGLRSTIVAAALSLTSIAAAAEGGRVESPTVLSSYQGYAEQVTAECVRNKAYGLSTNGMPLAMFCKREGDMAAMGIAHQIGPAPNRPGGGSPTAPPR
jgi:hypothetical protein